MSCLPFFVLITPQSDIITEFWSVAKVVCVLFFLKFKAHHRNSHSNIPKWCHHRLGEACCSISTFSKHNCGCFEWIFQCHNNIYWIVHLLDWWIKELRSSHTRELGKFWDCMKPLESFHSVSSSRFFQWVGTQVTVLENLQQGRICNMT